MDKLEEAELQLRRAQDHYNRMMQEKQKAEQQPTDQMALRQDPPGRPIDLDKVTSIEDIVALMKATGIKIMANPALPTFDDVEHLIADDVEDEDAPQH